MVNKKNGKNTPDEENKAKTAPVEPEIEVRDAQADDAAPEVSEQADAQGTAEEPKTITETEFLKLCYEQSMKELNRVKGELEKKTAECAELKAEGEKNQQKLATVVAEYENYRRRSAQEKEAAFADAVVKAVSALLPTLDSLEKAIQYADSDNFASFKQGVEMTLRQMIEGFEKIGVTEIEAEGAVFDPEKHNAVMHIEDESLGDSVVADVFQKGYAIGDRVVRHSVVKVAN